MQTTATFPDESTVRVTFTRDHPEAAKLGSRSFARDFAVSPIERLQAEREGRSIADHVLDREVARIEARRTPGPTLNRPIPVSTRAVPSHEPKASTGDRSPVSGSTSTKAKPTTKAPLKASKAPAPVPAPRAIPRATTAKPAGYDVPRLSREERAVASQFGLSDQQYVEHRQAMAARERADQEADRVRRAPVSDFDHVAKSFGCTVAELKAHEKTMKAREAAERDEDTRRRQMRAARLQPDGTRSTAHMYPAEPDEYDRRRGAK